MEKLQNEMTTGQLYDPAISVTTEAEARDYLSQLVERRLRVDVGLSFDLARKCELTNIRYYAGYGSAETFNRIVKLYNIPSVILTDAELIQIAKHNSSKR